LSCAVTGCAERGDTDPDGWTVPRPEDIQRVDEWQEKATSCVATAYP
jgi:hypothetical protein